LKDRLDRFCALLRRDAWAAQLTRALLANSRDYM
jgi:hypothetical protein